MEIIKKLIKHFQNGILIEKIFKYIIAILYKIYNSFLFRHIFNLLLINRRKIKKFEKSLMPIDGSFYKIANYYLPVKNKLDKNSNFLSFGVGADVDFEVELARSLNNGPLKTSSDSHIALTTKYLPGKVQYRQSINPSVDGNTVELAVEQMEFAQNSVRYQTTLDFINSKIRGLLSAIRGE